MIKSPIYNVYVAWTWPFHKYFQKKTERCFSLYQKEFSTNRKDIRIALMNLLMSHSIQMNNRWVNFFQKIANAEEPKFNNPTLSISNHQKPSGSSDGERINGSFDQQVF